MRADARRPCGSWSFTSWTTGGRSRSPGCGTRELDALLTCLKLRAPEALAVPFSAFSGYAGKSEEEWQELERAYQSRLSARKLDEESRELDAVRSDPCFVFSDLRGQHTSRFDRSIVAEQLAGLTGETRPVGLELLEPAPVPGINGVSLTRPGRPACWMAA